MKTILALLILFCVSGLPSLGELSDADLNRLRLIVKEEVNAEIESFEKNIKEYINTKNESVEKRLSLVTSLIVGLIALIGIPLVVLTVMIGWRSIKDSAHETKNIEVLEALIREQDGKIANLTQEIENLK